MPNLIYTEYFSALNTHIFRIENDLKESFDYRALNCLNMNFVNETQDLIARIRLKAKNYNSLKNVTFHLSPYFRARKNEQHYYLLFVSNFKNSTKLIAIIENISQSIKHKNTQINKTNFLEPQPNVILKLIHDFLGLTDRYSFLNTSKHQYQILKPTWLSLLKKHYLPNLNPAFADNQLRIIENESDSYYQQQFYEHVKEDYENFFIPEIARMILTIKENDLPAFKKLSLIFYAQQILRFEIRGKTIIEYAHQYNRHSILNYIYSQIHKEFLKTRAHFVGKFNKLHLAIYCRKDRKFIDTLLERNTYISIDSFVENTGVTSLILAIRTRNLDLVKFLCEKNANINLQYHRHDTALHVAVATNHFSIIEYLCQQEQTQFHLLDDDMKTPLDIAVTNNDLACVKLLGSFKLLKDKHNVIADAAYLALKNDLWEMFYFLVSLLKTNIHSLTRENRTLTLCAINSGKLDYVETLRACAYENNVRLTTKPNETPFETAYKKISEQNSRSDSLKFKRIAMVLKPYDYCKTLRDIQSETQEKLTAYISLTISPHRSRSVAEVQNYITNNHETNIHPEQAEDQLVQLAYLLMKHEQNEKQDHDSHSFFGFTQSRLARIYQSLISKFPREIIGIAERHLQQDNSVSLERPAQFTAIRTAESSGI